MQYLVYKLITILIGVALDLILGDPYNFFHPVKVMGNIISYEEKLIRRTKARGGFMKVLGLVAVLFNMSLAFLFGFLAIILFKINKYFYLIYTSYMVYVCLAARSLHFEAEMVVKELGHSLERGRKRLSYIVGRDTSELSEEEILKATIETVAENTSDGVISPLFYIAIYTPLGLVYKFINTMDSMWGYKNEKYGELGFFAAKIDDLVNLLPARLSALLILITNIFNKNIFYACKTFFKYRYAHASPNSAFLEAPIAGILKIRLGGPHKYFSEIVDKPYIGDIDGEVNKNGVYFTIKAMYKALALLVVVIAAIYLKLILK